MESLLLLFLFFIKTFIFLCHSNIVVHAVAPDSDGWYCGELFPSVIGTFSSKADVVHCLDRSSSWLICYAGDLRMNELVAKFICSKTLNWQLAKETSIFVTALKKHFSYRTLFSQNVTNFICLFSIS